MTEHVVTNPEVISKLISKTSVMYRSCMSSYVAPEHLRNSFQPVEKKPIPIFNPIRPSPTMIDVVTTPPRDDEDISKSILIYVPIKSKSIDFSMIKPKPSSVLITML